MKYIFYLSIQVFLDSLNLNIFFTTMASRNVSNRVFMVHLTAERYFCFTLYLWITSWAVIIVWIYLSFFFLFVFCGFCWFFLVMAMKGGGLINIMQFFMSKKFVFIYTISVNAIYIFFFTFILCGLRGTNKLYCSWSPLWFRSAKMAIKTYDFLRDPKFTAYDYVPCTSLISGMDLNHYFILIQQFLATVLEVLQFYII